MIVETLLAAIAILLLIPVLVIFVQVLLAYVPHSVKASFTPRTIKVAVLVPAHDEAEGIAATINSILPQLDSDGRLIVVADNCSDDTAKIARAYGAETIERHDFNKRGKGYALDFGISFLRKDPPDVVVIIDADCIINEHDLNKLASYAEQNNRPVQSLYLMLSPTDAGLKAKISEFAWVVKNLVRPFGYANLGLPCQLMGSGMAFPWEIISNVNLANGNIVEDVKLGVDLCKSGRPPLFYPDALVTSYFPVSVTAQSSQRTRWEHGHLDMILAEAPKLFWHAVSKRNTDLLAMIFDLSVPPLALLVAMLTGLLIFSGINYLAGGTLLPLLTATSALAILLLAILLAWWNWGRHIITISTFLFIPYYVLSKIPYYFSFVFKRQKNWVRTERK